MDGQRGNGRYLWQGLPGGWWRVVLAGFAVAAVGIVVLGIMLAVRLLLYLLGGIGPT